MPLDTENAKIVHDGESRPVDSRKLREMATIAVRQNERFNKDLLATVISIAERVEKLEAERCQCKV